MIRSRLFWTVAVLGVVLDLVSKVWIFSNLGEYERQAVIEGFFTLARVENRGGVWGIGQNLTIGFAIVRFSALFVILYLLKATRDPSRAFLVGLGLIFGGAVGNLWDTVVHGHVRDFLEFNLGFMVWPTFNVADSCITVGAFLLFFHFFFLGGDEVGDGSKEHADIDSRVPEETGS